MNQHTISGYTTTYNCIEMEYPLELCIRSLLPFCAEVVVVDGGSTDGTLELLKKLQKEDSRIRIFVEPVDFNHPRWAIHQDGYLKRKAREQCRGDYCWQTDTDEIVDPSSYPKIPALPELLKQTGASLLMLPMVEFWGSFDRIRADFVTWKQRISVNDKRIVHGIPKCHQLFDAAGHEYPRPFFSDSCNYIYSDTGKDVPTLVPFDRSFGEVSALPYSERQRMFMSSLENLPHVLHLSWLNLERKIRHYRKHWQKFHASMYNLTVEDTAAANVMFDKPWGEVGEEDIRRKAKELEVLGPRSFHHKINPTLRGETYPFTRPIPIELKNWEEETRRKTDTTKNSPTIRVHDLPLVTAVIPSYNKAPYLRESVESVLNQDYKGVEILIVNDGSTDNTNAVAQEIIRAHPHRDIKILEKQNGGISDTRNFGIKAARGDLILALDGDDLVQPTFLNKALRAMHVYKANLVTCDVEVFGAEPGEWCPREYEDYEIRYQNNIPTLVLYEKQLWEKTGGYKVALPIVEDWEFFISCSRYGLAPHKIEEKLFRYRSSTTGLAHIFKDSQTEVQSLIMSANEDLYPVEEVLFGLNHIARRMPQRFFDKFIAQDALHPREWLLKLWLGLHAEGKGDVQKAINYYVESSQLSNLKQWQPLYQIGRIFMTLGQKAQADEFLWSTKKIRPDMKRIIKELEDNAKRNQLTPNTN